MTTMKATMTRRLCVTACAASLVLAGSRVAAATESGEGAVRPSSTTGPLKVFILVGQSNMQGKGNVSTFDYIGMDHKTAPMTMNWTNCSTAPGGRDIRGAIRREDMPISAPPCWSTISSRPRPRG